MTLTRPLRDEWIPGRIAKHPEAREHRNPNPEIVGRHKHAALRFSGNRAPGITQKRERDKRQRHHEKRVELESRDRMQMQQLITSARGAASRTLPAGHQSKRTLRKPLIGRTGRIEKEKEQRSCRETRPNHRRNKALSRAKDRLLKKGCHGRIAPDSVESDSTLILTIRV